MKSRRRQEIQVGITVLVAAAVLLWGVTWLKEFSLASRNRVWHVRFEQTGGLGVSDEVQVNGIRKGAVDRMRLVGDFVLVDLALADDVMLTRDSQVSIRNVGLMGEKVIAVDLRTTGGAYSTSDTIVGVYEKGVPEVMASLGDAVGTIQELTRQLEAVASAMNRTGDLAGTMRNVREITEELNRTVKANRKSFEQTLDNFAAASRTARTLTADREAQLKKTIDHFASTAEKLDRFTGRLDSLRASMQTVTGRIERGEGSLGKLVNDDQLYVEAKASVASLKALIQDVKANPKKYLKLEVF